MTALRGAVVRISPEVLARLLDLPDDARIVSVSRDDSGWHPRSGRPIELTVIGGEGMPEFERSELPPVVDLIYVSDESKLGGGRLERIETVR